MFGSNWARKICNNEWFLILFVSPYRQLLGVALRADIPLALDLLSSFWKCLVGVALDPDRDLEEADCITYDYIKKLTEVKPSHYRHFVIFEWETFWDDRGQQTYRVNPLFSELCACSELRKQWKFTRYVCCRLALESLLLLNFDLFVSHDNKNKKGSVSFWKYQVGGHIS